MTSPAAPLSDDADDAAETARAGEGRLERADRNMLELLQELRVAQTGVHPPGTDGTHRCSLTI